MLRKNLRKILKLNWIFSVMKISPKSQKSDSNAQKIEKLTHTLAPLYGWFKTIHMFVSLKTKFS